MERAKILTAMTDLKLFSMGAAEVSSCRRRSTKRRHNHSSTRPPSPSFPSRARDRGVHLRRHADQRDAGTRPDREGGLSSMSTTPSTRCMGAAATPVQRSLQRIRLPAHCGVRRRRSVRRRGPASREATGRRGNPRASAPPRPRDQGQLAGKAYPDPGRQSLLRSAGHRLVPRQQYRLYPPRDNLHPAQACATARFTASAEKAETGAHKGRQFKEFFDLAPS